MPKSVELTNMKYSELRQLARRMGINPSGKQQSDLIREMEKKRAVVAGKSTPADRRAAEKAQAKKGGGKGPVRVAVAEPKKAAPAKSRKEEAEDDDQTIEEVVEQLKADVEMIYARVEELEAKLSPKKRAVARDAPKEEEEETERDDDEEVYDDDDSDEDEDGEEDEDSDEDTDDDEDEDTDDEENEDEEDEDEGEGGEEDESEDEEGGSDEDKDEDEDDDDAQYIEVTPDQLTNMSMEEMQDLADKLISTGANIDADVKSARILRQRLRAYLDENSENSKDKDKGTAKKGKAEPKSVAKKSSKELPEWLKKNKAVEVNVEGMGWVIGVVDRVESPDHIVVDIDDPEDEDSSYEVVIDTLDDIRQVPKAPPKATKARSR